MSSATGTVLAETCLERARSVAPILEAAHDRIDAEREMPKDVLEAMHAAALWRMSLPKSLGGGEVPPTVLSQMTEIIAKADASAGWVLGQGTGCAMSAAFMDDGPARHVFGPADAVLAWPGAELAVLGAEGAADLVFRRELERHPERRDELMTRYREDAMDVGVAAGRGSVSEIIAPEDSREALLGLLRALRDGAPRGFVHDNLPQ